MKPAPLAFAIILSTLTPLYAHSQADTIPSAAPVLAPGETAEQRGRHLLNEMVTALGGDAWLHRKDMTVKGRTAAFFRGAPTGFVVEYSGNRQFPVDGRPEAERIGFITDKSMILPGKKIDIVQVYVNGNGYEVTFKGTKPLPKDQVADYFRRRNHSIEDVVLNWLHQPGVVVISEGTSMVARRLSEKVTVLTDNNDAVTIDLDATTHLPLRREFKWRNEEFKDWDKDVEEYDDYHTIQGLPTAMTLTRYHDDDMTSQRFYEKVEYNSNLSPDLFNPDKLLQKKQ
jgi:hypothetical protein